MRENEGLVGKFYSECAGETVQFLAGLASAMIASTLQRVDGLSEGKMIKRCQSVVCLNFHRIVGVYLKHGVGV